MSKLELQAPKNVNYAATVVALKDFVDLPNCDNVKAALIFGNSVIVAKSACAGEIGLFFPVESQISKEFLGANNLFRKPEFGNVRADKKGFFEQHGRVKAVKFRGHKSEGFWIPIDSLFYLGLDPELFQDLFTIGAVFDAVGDHEICKKYVPKLNIRGIPTSRARVARLEDAFVDNQFRFHFDTANLRRNINKVKPTDLISITDKWHGTSVVIANVLVKRELPWYERLLKKIGVKIQENTHGLAYSSRRVVKAVNGRTKASNHFYSEDIWGVVAKEIEEKVPKGFTLYGEIVGFTPEGSPIQGGYHYGCKPGEHRLLIYRVTSTNPDGQVLELTWFQVLEFCAKYGLEPVNTLYLGSACSLYPYLSTTDVEEWQREFLFELEKQYIKEGMCPFNNFEVPAEGIVLRIERLNECESYKLKNFRFLEHESTELDKGTVDLETAESEELTVSTEA